MILLQVIEGASEELNKLRNDLAKLGWGATFELKLKEMPVLDEFANYPSDFRVQGQTSPVPNPEPGRSYRIE